jgi:hypothetical protein
VLEGHKHISPAWIIADRNYNVKHMKKDAHKDQKYL